MDFVSTKVRFRVIGPSSEGHIDIDSWTVEGDNNSANRTIIKLAYKYMCEVVNDALYNPEDCSLSIFRISPLMNSQCLWL